MMIAGDHPQRRGWARVRYAYFSLLIALTLTIALASFVRDRGQLLSNVSLWLFLIPFAVSIWRTGIGFVVAIFMTTVAPSLHVQVNAIAGTTLHGWAYPAVDCCVGFLAAWAMKGGLRSVDEVLDRFPAGPVLLFHAWLTFSAVIATGRNLWQSASELSARGLTYNVWLTRGISWRDDYYPVQDPFFFSVAVAMLFCTWTLLTQDGSRLLRRLLSAVLAGAFVNVAFVIWQKATGLGWVNGNWSINANAFWPDLHSFGVFMAMALFVGYGFLSTQWVSARARAAALLATSAAAVGLYLSGSRSTLFFVFAVLIAWTARAVMNARGWRRVLPIAGVFVVLGIVHFTLLNGYRGLSYEVLGQQARTATAASLNLTLSYRPEIWAAALRMYLEFPFFGLGQGAFYRLSAIPEFSHSEFLVMMRGEGVHNDFFRILVELGPVGVGLLLFAAIPVVRLGRINFRCASFYALVAIAIGNVYTNTLLVRELLVLTGVMVGSYLWEAQSIDKKPWQPPTARATRYATAAMVLISVAALIEVAFSLNRSPFRYAQLCQEIQPLGEDGWTQGAARIPVPPSATKVQFIVRAERPDLVRRPLDLDVTILGAGGRRLASERLVFGQGDSQPRQIEWRIPDAPDGKLALEVKPSNCYVPLNLGITYDPRRLGVRVKELRFITAAGDEVR